MFDESIHPDEGKFANSCLDSRMGGRPIVKVCSHGLRFARMAFLVPLPHDRHEGRMELYDEF